MRKFTTNSKNFCSGEILFDINKYLKFKIKLFPNDTISNNLF